MKRNRTHLLSVGLVPAILLGVAVALVAEAPKSSSVALESLDTVRADSLTVLSLKASGPFRYRSRRVSGNSVWIDLENVNRGSLKRAGSLNGALIGYRVLEFEGESGTPFSRLHVMMKGPYEFSLEPQASGLKMTFGPDEVAPQPMGRTGATTRTREMNSNENDVKAEPEPRVEKVSLRNETRMEEVSPAPLASALTPARLYVVRLRESHQGGVSRIKIETSEPVRFKAFRLENPSRVVVDLRGVRSRVGRYRTFPFHSKLLERVRLAQFRDRDPAVVRVVADLIGSPRYRVTTVDGGILIELRGRAPLTAPAPIFASRRERKPKELAKASTSTSTSTSTASLSPTPSVRREEVEASLPPSGSSPRVTAAVKPRPGPDPHALRAAKAARTLAGSLAPASAYQEPGGLTGLASSATKQEGEEEEEAVEEEVAEEEAAEAAVQTEPEAEPLLPSTEPEPAVVEPEPAVVEPEPAVVEPEPAVVEPELAPEYVEAEPEFVEAEEEPAPEAEPEAEEGAPFEEEARYTGEPISVNLKDVDLKDFFRLIHEISGLNLIVDPNVLGSVTMVLDSVPWDQALDIVLKNNRLGRVLEENVLRIAMLETLRAEQQQLAELNQARQEAAPLITKFHTLNYAQAAELIPTLTQFLSPRGKIIQDDRTNTLIISEIETEWEMLDGILARLDRKVKQVSIEARIVLASRDFVRSFGTQLSFATANASGGTSVSGDVLTPNPGTNNASIFIINSGANYLVDALLSFGETTTQAKTISRPKIVTQDNEEALIRQGAKIPVQTVINNTPTTTFIDALLRLTVTPRVTEDGNIFLTVDVENSTPGALVPGALGSATPAIDTQQASTKILVPDGSTLVFGGVTVQTQTKSQAKVPFFGDIPLLGHLFRSSVVTDNDKEFIFLITPRVLPG